MEFLVPVLDVKYPKSAWLKFPFNYVSRNWLYLVTFLVSESQRFFFHVMALEFHHADDLRKKNTHEP